MDEDPDKVVPAYYGELSRLAWNRDPQQPITGQEALALYEANWRHVDVACLSGDEITLIQELIRLHGAGHSLIMRDLPQ